MTCSPPLTQDESDSLLLMSALQDRGIGRVIWQIGGNVPAANFIRLPQLHSASLGLTGRILYLQVLTEVACVHCLLIHLHNTMQNVVPHAWAQCEWPDPMLTSSRCYREHKPFGVLQVQLHPMQYFAIHVEVLTQEGNPCRLSISNVYDAAAIQASP